MLRADGKRFLRNLQRKGVPYDWLPCGGCIVMECPCCGRWDLVATVGDCRLGGAYDPRHKRLLEEFVPPHLRKPQKR